MQNYFVMYKYAYFVCTLAYTYIIYIYVCIYIIICVCTYVDVCLFSSVLEPCQPRVIGKSCMAGLLLQASAISVVVAAIVSSITESLDICSMGGLDIWSLAIRKCQRMRMDARETHGEDQSSSTLPKKI